MFASIWQCYSDVVKIFELNKKNHNKHVANTMYIQIPIDILVEIFTWHIHPNSLRLISKGVRKYVDTDEFYRKVCYNYGYNNISISAKLFFLKYIDISNLKIPINYSGYYNIWLVNNKERPIKMILVFEKFATLGQIRHIFMTFYDINIPIPNNPHEIIKINLKHPYKMRIK
jgi:hypothetical protein